MVQTIKKHLKKASSIVAAGVLLFSQAAFVPTASAAQNKVWICHANSAINNVYNYIEVNESAVDGQGNGDHYLEHNDPIFNSTMVQGDDWGDIIPPVAPYHNGLNWTAQGQAIYNNQCKVDSSITLVKNVVNDNGGTAVANDFGLSIGGTSVTSGQTLTLAPGTYAINELGLNGYAFTGIAGTDCPAHLGGTVDLGTGEHITCTITNDDIAPTMTVVKNVINDDGGTLLPSDFTMQVNTPTASQQSFPGDSAGTTVTLNAGSYSVTEIHLPGYAPSYSADCTGTIALGENKTCTITNDDMPAQITVTKQVINDNGGTAVAGDFTLKVNNTVVQSGATNNFAANTQYTISETGGPSTYDQTSLTCYVLVGNAQVAVANPFIPALGHSYYCTIVNDDKQPAQPPVVVTPVTPQTPSVPQVLGASTTTTTAPTLVKTGVSAAQSVLVGLTILSALAALHFLTRRSKNYSN